MLLGAISDTHDSVGAVDRAIEVFDGRGVALVVHAGDWCAPFALSRFRGLKAGLRGVYGNVDGERTRLGEAARRLGFNLEDLAEVEVGGLKVAVIHGVDERIVRALARCGEYRLLVRGHTHQPSSELQAGCLVVNPGEACGYLTGRRTLTVIDTDTMHVDTIEF